MKKTSKKNYSNNSKKRNKKNKAHASFVNFAIFISAFSLIFSFLFTASIINSNFLRLGNDLRDQEVLSEKTDSDLMYLSKVKNIFDDFAITGSISVGMPQEGVVLSGISFDDNSVDFSYKAGKDKYWARLLSDKEENNSDSENIFIVSKNNFKY